MSDLSVNVVFCDDVRREADGRLSVMGVFDGIRVLPSHVETLPKTTILSLVSAVPGLDLSKVAITVSVFRDGELEHEESYPALPQEAVADPRLEEAAKVMGAACTVRAYFAGLVELQSFPVHGGCSIKVAVTRADELLSEHGVVFVHDDSADSEGERSYSVRAKKKRSKKKA